MLDLVSRAEPEARALEARGDHVGAAKVREAARVVKQRAKRLLKLREQI